MKDAARAAANTMVVIFGKGGASGVDATAEVNDDSESNKSDDEDDDDDDDEGDKK